MIDSVTKLAWACALGAALAAAPAVGQAIQLRHGQVLVGEVQDATGDGLTFRRLDNGGVLELSWSDLTPHCANEIRRLKGLLVEDEQEPKVMADVLIYEVAGGIRQEIVGRLDPERETPDSFWIRRKGDAIEIERRTIKDRKKREVPIFEVYTQDSYYAEQLQEVAPGDDADKHIELADRLRRAGDYVHAEEHLVRADELGGGRQRSQLQTMLQRVRTLRESEAERELLARIRHMRARKEFDKAAELIAEFEQTFADSELMADLEREKRRFEDDREFTLTDRIRSMWDRAIYAVANDKVADSRLSLAAARDYAEGGMADDVFEHVGRVLDVDPKEVETLWQSRQEHGKGRAIVYDYGVGSWVLGEDAIIKDTKVAEGQTGDLDTDSDDPELKRIVRLIREHKQRARQIAQQQKGDTEETDESWWKALKLTQKRQWLRVYFAEFGGQMEVTAAYASPCGNCDGEGAITQLGAAGRPQKQKCPVCHGTRYTRLIRAR